MKKLLAVFSILSLSLAQAFATDTIPARFRKTIPPGNLAPRKHELRISGGFSAGDLISSFSGRGMLLSATYARGFRGWHYLRAGIRINDVHARIPGNGSPYPPISPNPAVTGGDSSSYSLPKIQTKKDITVNTQAGIFIGYEKAFGAHKVKFTIGADLYAGYHALVINTYEAAYTETRTFNPATGLFDYDFDFTRYGNTYSTDRRIVLGLSPRIGLRWQISPFFGLGLALNPLIGYTHRIAGSETTTGDRPLFPGSLKSYWFVQQNAEASLIFSFAKRKPREPKS